MREPESYSVGVFLELVSQSLLGLRSVVHGEVTSVDFRGNYLFFKLKDEYDESVLPCFMWMRAYQSSGVSLAEGMKISALGVPEIFKARGSFSFQAAKIAEIGEGVLKKRYDELKKKLELEGLFAPERKQPLPELPETIGLVTSATGAVIHDFRNNLGKRGIKVLFHDTRVEGQFAEGDIVRALRHFRGSQAEIVVVIRGGGSLESLAAFNSEAVVREIAAIGVPVISGIGHDKDVPLAALAADFSVSTPTAAAELINRIFDARESELAALSMRLGQSGESALDASREAFFLAAQSFQDHAARLFELGRTIDARFRNAVALFERSFAATAGLLSSGAVALMRGFQGRLRAAADHIARSEEILGARNPQKALDLGYGIIRGNKGLVRSVAHAKIGDEVALQVSDGTMEAQITKIEWLRKKDSRKI